MAEGSKKVQIIQMPKAEKNIAIIYFSEDLKYGKYIRIFDDIKRIGNMKVSIKPAGAKSG